MASATSARPPRASPGARDRDEPAPSRAPAQDLQDQAPLDALVLGRADHGPKPLAESGSVSGGPDEKGVCHWGDLVVVERIHLADSELSRGCSVEDESGDAIESLGVPSRNGIDEGLGQIPDDRERPGEIAVDRAVPESPLGAVAGVEEDSPVPVDPGEQDESPQASLDVLVHEVGRALGAQQTAEQLTGRLVQGSDRDDLEAQPQTASQLASAGRRALVRVAGRQRERRNASWTERLGRYARNESRVDSSGKTEDGPWQLVLADEVPDPQNERAKHLLFVRRVRGANRAEGDVDVDALHRLTEERQADDLPPLGVHDDAASVQDHLVIATHGVDENDTEARAAREVAPAHAIAATERDGSGNEEEGRAASAELVGARDDVRRD